MGTNLSMNRSAALPDRRQPNAQCLTHGTATLSRTNQSDQDNFTGSERVFLSEKTYPAKGWTRGLAILREVIIVSRGRFQRISLVRRCVVRLSQIAGLGTSPQIFGESITSKASSTIQLPSPAHSLVQRAESHSGCLPPR